MRVEDVMTREVLTAGIETPLKEVAAILTEYRISGLPVIADDGKVVGVVSEADILEKESGACMRVVTHLVCAWSHILCDGRHTTASACGG